MQSAINPFILNLLAMFVRYAIVATAGAIGVSPDLQAYINENMSQFTQFSLAAAGVLGTVGYAVWVKFFDKQKLVQALSEAGKTEKTIESMVKSAGVETPSVLTPKTEVPS